MENYKLKVQPGQHFQAVSVTAQTIAQLDKTTVEFAFNGVTCLVNTTTNLDHLYRDYGVAHTMQWKTIGPDCAEAYSDQMQDELDRRNTIAAMQAKEELRISKQKDDAERAAFEQTVQGVELELVERFKYSNWKAKNRDAYGRAIFDYAEGWARLMQKAISSGQSVAECARSTSFQLGFLGISGMQYSMAVSVLIKSWSHGKELAAWHDAKLNPSPYAP